jgi:hypothetical protein
MPAASSSEGPGRPRIDRPRADLIPAEFLRVIAVWSLIPAYLLAGAFLGYLVDRWIRTWPFGVGIGLIIALGFAVRDMLRLRDSL